MIIITIKICNAVVRCNNYPGRNAIIRSSLVLGYNWPVIKPRDHVHGVGTTRH